MTLNRGTLFQLFKYAVYSLLTLNIYLFWQEEFQAALLQHPGGVPWRSIFDAYAATIDTAAWVVLLLMFELETYVLEDKHFSPPVRWLLHGARFASYAFILFAFFGYVTNVIATYDVSILSNVADLCALPASEWSYASGLDEYTAITAENCRSFGTVGAPYYQYADLPALVDAQGMIDIQRLAWVDAINSIVWILIVVILEIDVRLQERNKLVGRVYRISYSAKIVLYTILFAAAVYWGVKGDFVDFWDAFLWLLAFFFIEMNVVEWREEELEEQAAKASRQPSA